MRSLALCVLFCFSRLAAASTFGAPVGLTVAATGNAGELSVAWSAGQSPVAVTGYQLYRATDPLGVSGTTPTYVTVTSLVQTGLSNGQSYWYAVQADTTQTADLSLTQTALPYALLDAPGLTVTALSYGAGQFMAWSPPTLKGLALGAYRVELMSGANVASALTVAANATAVTVTALCGTSQTYQLRAVDVLGHASSPSAQSSVSYPCAPFAIGASLNSAALTLGWTAVASPLSATTQYEVRSATYSAAALADTVSEAVVAGSLSSASATINAIPEYTARYYRVYATSTGGIVSAASNEIAPMLAPTNLSATARAGRVDLNWTVANNSQAMSQAGYELSYSTSPGLTPPNLGSTLSMAVTPTVSGGAAYCSVTGLVNGTTYYFALAAFGGQGSPYHGPLSNVVSATAGIPSPVITNFLQVQGGAIAVSWSAVDGSPDTALAYALAVGYDPLTASAVTWFAPVSVTALLGVTPSADALATQWFVAASGNASTSALTPTRGLLYAPVLSTPTGMAALTSNGRVTLTWNGVPGASEYQVYRSTQAGVSATTQASWVSAGPTFTDFFPANGQGNDYRVLARRRLSLSGAYVESPLGLTLTVAPVIPPGIPGAYPYADSVNGKAVAAYLTVSAGPLNDRVDLSWTPSAAGSRVVDHYRIYSGQSLGALAVVASVTSSASTYDYWVSDPLTRIYGIDAVDSSGLAGPLLTGTARAYNAWPAPQTPTAYVLGTAARLAWSPPAGQGTHAFVSYRVSRSDISNTAFVALADVTYTSYIDTALTNAAGTLATYGIAVVDSQGIQGALTSTAVNFMPAPTGVSPTAVTHVSARTLMGTAVPALVQWAANPQADQVAGYAVYRDGAFLATTSANSYQDNATVPGSSYTYQVQALNAQGSGLSGTASPAPLAVTPPQVGGVAAVLTADVSGNAVPSLRLTWDDEGIPAGADGYSVYRAAGPFTTIGAATFLATVTVNSYTDSSVPVGTHQSYVVLGKVLSYESSSPTAGLALSLSVNAATVQPTGLAALTSSSGVALSWAAQGQAKCYWVFRSTAALGSYPAVAVLATVTAAAYNDATADPAQTYHYAVAALNELSQGPTAEISGVIAAPGKVSALAIVPGYSGAPQIELDWTPPLGPALAASYQVYRDTDPAAFTANTATLVYSGAAATFTDTGAATNTAYYYQVRAVNQVSSTGNEVRGPFKAFLPPSTVQGVRAVGGAAGIDLVWDSPNSAEGVTGYALSVLPDPNFGVSSTALVSGHSYTVANVGLAQGVSIAVTALNSAGGSAAAVTVFAVANSVGPIPQPLSFNAQVGFFETSDATLRVILSWSPTAVGQTLLVYRDTQPIALSLAAGGPASPLYLTGVSGTFQALTDAAVDASHTYYYALSFVGPTGLPGGESSALRSPGVVPFSYPARAVLSSQAGVSRVDLSWIPPTYLGTTHALADPAYKLYRYTTASNVSVSVHTIQAPDLGFPKAIALSVTAYTDLLVANGSYYQYALAVVDSAGREQGVPDIANRVLQSPHGQAVPPTGIDVTPGDSAVTLRLLASVYDTAQGLRFNVYRRLQNGGDYGQAVPKLYLAGPSNIQVYGGSLTQTVVTLRDDQSPVPQNTVSYCYAVTQLNEYGESGKSQEVCTTPYRPIRPVNLKLNLNVVGKKDVQLTWDPTVSPATVDANSNTPNGFRLFRSQDGGTTYKVLGDLVPGTASFTDLTTEFGASYVYRLVPMDTLGYEGVSFNLASVIIPSAKNAVLLFRNSFDPATGEVLPVQFSLLQPGHAWVRVYTLQGDFVASLFDEDVPQASVESPFLSEKKSWDGKNADGQTVASGVYLVHLEAPGFRENARVAVIK